MALSNLTFSKDWTNEEDFPTIETSETQVREDLQILHNESRDAINAIVEALRSIDVSDSGAGCIGAAGGSDVQSVLDSHNTRISAAEVVDTMLSGITEVTTSLVASNANIPTGKAVADAISEAGGGNMMRESYDTTGTGTKVDTALNAEKFGNKNPEYYQKALEYDTEPTSDSTKMVNSGNLYSYIASITQWLGKKLVLQSEGTSASSSGYRGFNTIARNDFDIVLTKDDTGTYATIPVPVGAKKLSIAVKGVLNVNFSSTPYGSTAYVELNGASTGVSYLIRENGEFVIPVGGTVYDTIMDGEVTVDIGRAAVSTDYIRLYFGRNSSDDRLAMGQFVMEVIE